MNRILFASASALALFAGLASAQAADLPRRPMPAKAPEYVAPAFSWTGGYIGINGGGAWGHSTFSGALPSAGSFDVNGGLVGATLGYNWQAGPAVFGIEGDIDWADNRGSSTCGGFSCQTRNDWLGTLRGHLGYAAGRFMPYVTGGAAFGNIKSSITGFGSSNSTQVGWTVGGGLEAALVGPWTAKIEYLYVDLGSGDTIAGSHSDFQTNVVRAGLNYRF